MDRAKCFDFLGRDCYNKRKVETLPVRFPETDFDFFHAEGVAMTIKDIAKLSGVGVSTAVSYTHLTLPTILRV